jgi:hypothetical protein
MTRRDVMLVSNLSAIIVLDPKKKSAILKQQEKPPAIRGKSFIDFQLLVFKASHISYFTKITYI